MVATAACATSSNKLFVSTANGSTPTPSTGRLMNSLSRHIVPLLFLFSFMASNAFAQTISSTDTTAVYTIRGTFYHDRFVGRKTSSGEVFRQDRYTAAHHYLKFGTLLLVTNPKNGKQVIVRINDRCPRDKILDMTRLAANTIGIKSSPVEIRVLPPRFSELWEHQDQLQEVLSNGQLLEYAFAHSTGLKTHPKKTASGKSPQHTTTDNNNHLYDIELLQGMNIDLEKSVSQLPLYLQDKVGLRSINGSKSHSMVIFLSLPHDKATQILDSVKAKFPDATLIKSE